MKPVPVIAAALGVVGSLCTAANMPAMAQGHISVVRVQNGTNQAVIMDVTVSYFPNGQERKNNIRINQSAEFPPKMGINAEAINVTITFHGDVKGRPIRGGCSEQIFSGKPALYIVRLLPGQSIPGTLKCRIR